MTDRLLIFDLDGERLGMAVDEEGRAYGRFDASGLALRPGWYDDANVVSLPLDRQAELRPDEPFPDDVPTTTPAS